MTTGTDIQGQPNQVAKFLKDTIQIAYVTRDLQAAIDMLGEKVGIRTFMETGAVKSDLGGGAIGELSVAMAYCGNTQYELIQPISGAVDIHRNGLPTDEGPLLAFHHVSYFARSREDLETVRPIVLGGRKAPVFGEFGEESAFFYVDECPTLGHYVEYQYSEPAYDALIPRN